MRYESIEPFNSKNKELKMILDQYDLSVFDSEYGKLGMKELFKAGILIEHQLPRGQTIDNKNTRIEFNLKNILKMTYIFSRFKQLFDTIDDEMFKDTNKEV